MFKTCRPNRLSSWLFIILIFGLTGCQSKKAMVATIESLEERVVLLESALKANQTAVDEIADQIGTDKPTHVVAGDAQMPTAAPTAEAEEAEPAVESPIQSTSEPADDTVSAAIPATDPDIQAEPEDGSRASKEINAFISGDASHETSLDEMPQEPVAEDQVSQGVNEVAAQQEVDSTAPNEPVTNAPETLSVIDESEQTQADNIEPETVADAQPADETGSNMVPEQANIPVERLYNQSLTAYYAKQYDRAKDGFETILTYHRAHKLAPNALYWLGETAYSRYQYQQALGHFRRLVDTYATSPKAADALLKIGKCQERLGLDKEAIGSYQRLIESYPKSAAASKARSWM